MVKASDNTPKRNPFCSRCRNHGKKAQVKGHKRHCEYRNCKCGGCALVEARQFISAEQIRRRRYQKQDEECGRRIEVSPPVLEIDAAQDPASLLTRGLLRQIPHRQRSVPAEDDPSILVAAGQRRHQPNPLLAPGRLLPHHHPQQSEHKMPAQMQPPQAQQVTQLQHSGSSTSQAAPTAVVTSSAPLALGNALHLFQFHNPGYAPLSAPPLSASTVSSAVAAAAASVPTITPWARPTPNVCEQMQIVMDIYNSYGPLAIYSWLRSEQFNLAKIHYMIELSRAPYSDLLDLKYKTSSSNDIIMNNNNSHNNHTINNDNNNSSSSSTNSRNDSNNTTYEISTTSDYHRHMTVNLTRTNNRSSTHLN